MSTKPKPTPPRPLRPGECCGAYCHEACADQCPRRQQQRRWYSGADSLPSPEQVKAWRWSDLSFRSSASPVEPMPGATFGLAVRNFHDAIGAPAECGKTGAEILEGMRRMALADEDPRR